MTQEIADLFVEVRRQSAAIERLMERLAVDSAPVAVTKARAARELEVSVKTIDRMAREGELRIVLVRGMPRIPFSELLRVAKPKEGKREPTRVEKFNARTEAQEARSALRRLR